MHDELYIRWHSRAGQGAVTAANFFAEALTHFGYKVQSFPDYGAEKRGAPVIVFNRASKTAEILDDPAHLIRLDLVVLLDPTLVGAELEYEDVLKHLEKEGTLVINTSKKDKSRFNEKFEGSIVHLPATQIALDTVNRNVPNVAMVGGLTKILNLDFKKMEQVLEEHLSGFFPPKLVTNNLKGFERGYNETLEIK